MEFEEKFKSNKIHLGIFNDVFTCMTYCQTTFKDLLSERDVECLNTCGYNVAFVRDVALRKMLNEKKTDL